MNKSLYTAFILLVSIGLICADCHPSASSDDDDDPNPDSGYYGGKKCLVHEDFQKGNEVDVFLAESCEEFIASMEGLPFMTACDPDFSWEMDESYEALEECEEAPMGGLPEHWNSKVCLEDCDEDFYPGCVDGDALLQIASPGEDPFAIYYQIEENLQNSIIESVSFEGIRYTVNFAGNGSPVGFFLGSCNENSIRDLYTYMAYSSEVFAAYADYEMFDCDAALEDSNEWNEVAFELDFVTDTYSILFDGEYTACEGITVIEPPKIDKSDAKSFDLTPGMINCMGWVFEKGEASILRIDDICIAPADDVGGDDDSDDDADDDVNDDADDDVDDDVDDDADDDDDGTWTDPISGLVWQASPPTTPRSWEEAIDYCDDLSLAGGGWRLPTISEYRTLIRGCEETMTDGSCGVTDSCLDSMSCWDDSCEGCEQGEGPGQYGAYWPDEIHSNAYIHWYWSSSPVTNRPDRGWNVNFDSARIDDNVAGYSDLQALCVRD